MLMLALPEVSAARHQIVRYAVSVSAYTVASVN